MKLLYCIPSLFNAGGMERVLTEKVNYLCLLENYEITIVTCDQGGKPNFFQLNPKIRLIHLELNYFEDFSKNILNKIIIRRKKNLVYKKALRKIINEFNIEICISLGGKEIDFLYKIKGRLKRIVEFHFALNHRKQFLTSNSKAFIWKIIGSLRTLHLKYCCRKLDKIIVLTKNDLIDWRKSHSNVIQIPNPNFLKNIDVDAVRLNRIITVGRLDAQKGHDLLIDAWTIVAKQRKNWRLEIYGDGIWRDFLTEKIKNNKLENSVFLHGVETDLDKIYKSASIFVLSSRYEGFGMVLIEAMSYGIPVISFDCEHGPADLITNGFNGILVEPQNIKELAEKLIFLIDDEICRVNMGDNAKISVGEYSLDRIMPQWLCLFDELKYW